MEKFYLDYRNTCHIIQVIQSDKCLKIYEYGRFNEFYERVDMKFKLYSDITTLDDLLNYMDETYRLYNEGEELFITENDQLYIFNPKKKKLNILCFEKYSLTRCCYKNIYRTDDHELYVLHDTKLNELFVIEKSEFARNDTEVPQDLCDLINQMHEDKFIFTPLKYNRIKHFSTQLQQIGSIVVRLIPNYNDKVGFSIKFHEKPYFKHIKDKCCIYNMMQKISNSHYDRQKAKLIL